MIPIPLYFRMLFNGKNVVLWRDKASSTSSSLMITHTAASALIWVLLRRHIIMLSQEIHTTLLILRRISEVPSVKRSESHVFYHDLHPVHSTSADLAMPPSNTTLPNPMTNLAYLAPSVAVEIEVIRCVLLISTGATIWDVLSSFTEEVQLLFGGKLRLPMVVYWISRLSSVAFVFVSTVYKVTPVGHCNEFEKTVAGLMTIAVSTTSLLFFFRIRAVFHDSKIVVGFYFILWLSVVGGTFPLPFGATGGSIGPTSYCLDTGLKPYASASVIIPLIHDTLVFLAMSYRLLCNTRREVTLRGRLGSLWSRDHLPRFSATLLKGSQHYYLVAVCSNLTLLIMLYSKPLPVVMRTVWSIPNVFLTNSMACRIFRNARAAVNKGPRGIFLNTAGADDVNTIPLSFVRRRSDSNIDTTSSIMDNSAAKVASSIVGHDDSAVEKGDRPASR